MPPTSEHKYNYFFISSNTTRTKNQTNICLPKISTYPTITNYHGTASQCKNNFYQRKKRSISALSTIDICQE
ncbi:MAG: hypothetical protein Q8880_12765 [Bacteroidota bacterium]|nr:hypothetical protein [Bacteroidota bacterium]